MGAIHLVHAGLDWMIDIRCHARWPNVGFIFL